MYKKIILGTANFNNSYGFRKKKFKNPDLKRILELNSKVRNSIDTAIAYKNSPSTSIVYTLDVGSSESTTDSDRVLSITFTNRVS